MLKKLAIILLALGLAGLACDKKSETTTTPAQDTAAASTPAKTDDAKPAEPAETAEPVKLGKALAGAEEVTVEALLKDPKGYEGKTVRVAGKVEDFCHHKRAWFGVTAENGKGMVRVFTLPRFETPMDCKGKRAVAEGKVEVITIPADQVAHYSKEHKFLAGVEVKEGQPVFRPVIRAFGAELQ